MLEVTWVHFLPLVSPGPSLSLKVFKYIFTVFIEFIIILFLFYFLVFLECGVLAPRLGIEPTPSALEGEVLTTGLPKKSLQETFYPNNVLFLK